MKQDEFFARHMFDAAEEIKRFLDGMTYEQLINDPKTMYAIVRLFEILGEAANNLSEDFRARHPEIPLTEIIGIRNRLIHRYFEVDFQVLWQVYQHDLDSLLALLQKSLE